MRDGIQGLPQQPIARGSAQRATRIAAGVAFAWLLIDPRVVFAQEWKLRGFSPDAQVVGAAGFGLDEGLDNPFLGRLRLGVLYAFEPFLISGGVTGEVGGLVELGLGGELEWSAFDGPFAGLGIARTQDARAMIHVSAGFMLFGLEWQHEFGGSGPSDALLFEVRLPIGTWWLTRKKAERRPARSSQPQAALTPAAAAQPLSAQPLAAQPGANTPTPAAAPTQPLAGTPEPARAAPLGESAADPSAIDRALRDAAEAASAGDPSRAAEILRSAYASTRARALLLPLAEAELARGSAAAASDRFREYLGQADGELPTAERAELERRVRELATRTATLRLSLLGARGDERIFVDAEAKSAAALGYDLTLDPGQHMLEVRRGERQLAARSFSARAGELIRLELALP